MRQDLAWDGDHLRLDPAATKRVLGPYLSPSSASAIRQCPARHAAECTLPHTDHPFGVAELGTAAHAVLEDLYNLPAPHRTRRAGRQLLTERWRHESATRPELTEATRKHRWFAATWLRIRGIYQIEDPTKILVRRTEWAIGRPARGGGP
jgi:putative RecB family exonuclease